MSLEHHVETLGTEIRELRQAITDTLGPLSEILREALNDQKAASTTPTPTPTPQPPTPPAAKRKPRKKTAPTPVPDATAAPAEPEPKPEPEPVAPPPPTPIQLEIPTPEPDLQAVRAKFKHLVKHGGRGVAVDILDDFGATKVTELKPADYAPVIAEIEKELVQMDADARALAKRQRPSQDA